eukprot:1712369-Rhodomonas_salina.2
MAVVSFSPSQRRFQLTNATTSIDAPPQGRKIHSCAHPASAVKDEGELRAKNGCRVAVRREISGGIKGMHPRLYSNFANLYGDASFLQLIQAGCLM